jgi:hypothetical protein
MADESHSNEPHEHDDDGPISFPAFVLSLAHTTAVHLGDVPDPVTGSSGEVNLAAAHQMIDILSLLEVKTRGNLSAEERQLLDQILYELRLRFVEVARAAGRPGATTPAGPKKEESRIITPDEPRIIIP